MNLIEEENKNRLAEIERELRKIMKYGHGAVVINICSNQIVSCRPYKGMKWDVISFNGEVLTAKEEQDII